MVRARALAAALAAVLLTSSCTGTEELSGLRIMVPNAPGSGYDLTARTAAEALEEAGIARGVEVFNLPGAGGSVGVHRLVYERGNGRLVMLMGLGVVGSQYGVRRGATLADTTAVARLIQEPDMVVVTHDSPLRTIHDLVAAWLADPAKMAVGGGSLPGGPDHLAPMLMAEAIGLAPRSVRYVRYDGGGELLAAILGKEVAFGVSGVDEYASQVRNRQLRVLAVTGAERVPGLDAPTLREAGVHVVFTNWRGVVAPPGLAAADARALHDTMRRLHASAAWRAAMARNGWADAYLEGPAFGAFIREEYARLNAVMAELGLA